MIPRSIVTGKLVMALGGWLPAAFPRRLVCPGWFLPGRVGTRTAIWRQKLCTSKADKAIDLQNFATKLIGLTGLVRRASEHVTARS